MAVRLQLAGQMFTRLTVLRLSHIGAQGTFWVCGCECGKEVTVLGKGLKCGKHTSCGCRKGGWNIRHGLTGTKTYKAWQHMKVRCSDPKDRAYRYYGERGITFDPRWESFDNFLADMGEIPPGLTLERIDVNGNYSKANCRWATHTEQIRNRRNTLFLTVGSETRSHGEWAEIAGIDYRLIWQRLNRDGRTPEEAIGR